MIKGATRMELSRLRARLRTAERGHKMLKDKTDEMIRRFSVMLRAARLLRTEVEGELPAALSAFVLAKADCEEGRFLESILMPANGLRIQAGTGHILSVPVPEIGIEGESRGDFLPYSFASMPAGADLGVNLLGGLLPKLLSLAEAEKSCHLLAREIERTKRRVNALEYVMIPETRRDIRQIVMKLEEYERSSTVRLMKIKSKFRGGESNG